MVKVDYRAARAQKAILIGKPFALMAVYLTAASLGSWWWLAALFVIPFLSSTMSVVMHDVGHGMLAGRTRHLLLFILGACQMLSGHAFWATHAQHHRKYPADELEDPEGAPATESFSSMVKSMPTFAPRLWLWSWRNKPAIRNWLGIEILVPGALLVLATVLWYTYSSLLLLVYCLSTLGTGWVGYTLVAWLSHQETILREARLEVFAGTFIGSILTFFFGVIIFHEEHHAQEAVPSCNLARFAKSLQCNRRFEVRRGAR